MRVAVLLLGLLLAACTERPSTSFDWLDVTNVTPDYEEGWPFTRAPDFPYGTWISASGYRIELRRDGTYRVCLTQCDTGAFSYSGSGIIVMLNDFNVPGKPVAQGLIAAVDSQSRREKDLDFSPNLGSPINTENCAGRPCVLIGPWRPGGDYIFVLQS